MATPIQNIGRSYPAGPTHGTVWAMNHDELDIKTYSLAEVAEMVLPPDMTNGVRWLSNRLNVARYRGIASVALGG
jgi:hypothetical protein